MERRSYRGKKVMIGCVVLLIAIGVMVGWLERTTLLAWYFTRGLSGADEHERATWLVRVASLDDAAVPCLLRCLYQADSRVCANAQAGLELLAERWPETDSRRIQLATALVEAFAKLSPSGQQAALEMYLQLAPVGRTQESLAGMVPLLERLLAVASRQSAAGVHFRAMTLAARLLDQGSHPAIVPACANLIRLCLRDETPANRLLAIRLAQHKSLSLLEPVAALLGDANGEVRRAALLAVGATPTAISTEDLLASLHDPDPEVRTLCAKALRSRGLTEEHIKLGRLLKDERAETRLQVLELLHQAIDLDSMVWLRSLSHDQSPAVRAATIRAASEGGWTHLTDRLEQMAQSDPSPTVRQLAQFYLSCSKTPGPR
jgi:hypothetical protein